MPDSLLTRIDTALSQRLDPDAFEDWVCEVLSPWYPTLVRVRGGNDAGMDGHGEIEGVPFFLVATTGRAVIANLTRNLKSHFSSGSEVRALVVATSEELSGRRQVNLVQAATKFGFDLDVSRIYDRAALASLFYRHPEARRRLLGIDEPAPALSSISWVGRADKARPLIGREKTLDELRASTGDIIVVGKPGIGKTAVLEELALEGWGLFDTGATRGVLIDALLTNPRRVIADDAHLVPGRLAELAAIRREFGRGFEIVATTWPGSVDEIAAIMPSALRVTIDELIRADILEVVRQHGVHGPRELQAIIVRQSMGRPGLAATLSAAAVASNPNHVAAGDVLLSQTVSFYKRLLGGEASALLAVYALAGDDGLGLGEAATAVDFPLGTVATLVKSLAQGGVLDERRGPSGKDRYLRVQPTDLQYSLVKSQFGGPGGADALAAFLTRLPRPADAIVPIVGAVHRGAENLRPLVRRFISSSLQPTTAAAIATLGEIEASSVLATLQHPPLEVARAALSSSPELAAKALLSMDAGLYDMRHSRPEDPPRVLADFLAGPDGSLAVRRRIATAVDEWVANGGSSALGLEALSACVDPQFRDNYSDPGAGNTITLVEHPQSAAFVRDLMPLWDLLFRFLQKYEVRDYRALIHVVHNWMWPRILGFGQDLPPLLADAFESAARQISTRLMEILESRPGVLAEIRSLSELRGFETGAPRESDYDILFPDERGFRDRDYDEWGREVASHAVAWATRVADLGIAELIARVTAAEQEAATAGRTWPRLTTLAVKTAVHGKPAVAAEAFRLAMVQGLPGDYVGEILAELCSYPQIPWEQLVDLALDGSASQFAAMELALTKEVPAAVREKAILLLDGRHRNLIEVLALRDQLTDDALLSILRHGNSELRDAAAGHIRSIRNGPLSAELDEARASAIARGNPDDYWIRVALERDPRLLRRWIERHLATDHMPGDPFVFVPRELAKAISELPEGDRVEIISSIEQPGRLPFSFDTILSALVEESPTAVVAVFENPALKRWQAATLHAEINEEWLRRARLAVLNGWTVTEAVQESMGQMMGWSGNESAYWDRIVRFFSAVEPGDPVVSAIAAKGTEYFSARRDRAVESELREGIFGLDGR